MRRYTMYVCEKCKKESSDINEIKLCEAKHYGLNSIEELEEYDLLVKIFDDASRILSCAQNPELLQRQDDALKELMNYEKEHNMKL